MIVQQESIAVILPEGGWWPSGAIVGEIEIQFIGAHCQHQPHHSLRSPPPVPPRLRPPRLCSPAPSAPAIRRRAATTPYSPAPHRRRCCCPPPSPASTTAPRPARRPPHCRGPTRARRPDACAPLLLSSPVTLPCPSRPWPGQGPSCPGRTLLVSQKLAGPCPTRGPISLPQTRCIRAKARGAQAGT